MKLGFALPYAGSWATPENQLLIARRAEELGYASLWTAQRSCICCAALCLRR